MNVETALVKANDISVYESDIVNVMDNYIASLPDANMIYKSAVFTGLLDSIYKRLLKPVITNDYGVNNRQYDYKVLNDIFYNIYIPLCYRFDITPTVIAFCVLCNISNKAISGIHNHGFYSDNKVNKTITGIIEKWYQVCESGLLNRAISSNSIGSIFALKSVYQYSDNQTIRIESNITDNHETAAEIMARHNSAMIPQKPDLSDNLNA